ncbi:MAG: glucose-1-phosphate thymidylyltransferase [Acidimicrobiia bacterium]|nr:glucose-1-phosphate thymidylyltransferase [Acidimicrobiia bacterium]
MPTKALVLAGGSGTRLRPITHTSAKQLVPLANRPILFYCLDAIAAVGIRDVGIIVGETAPMIKDAVGDGGEFGLDVTYIHQEAPLGLGHCVLIARDYLASDPFIMYLGDNFLVDSLSSFVEEFDTTRPSAQILLKEVEDPRQFGVAIIRDGEVVGLVEKPPDPPSNLALIGVYMFDVAIHEAVRAIRPSARGELEITDAIQWLIEHDHVVRSHVIEGDWIDTGKRQDILAANRIVLDLLRRDLKGTMDPESRVVGRVVVEPGAKLVRSEVRGPAIVGTGTQLIDSFVGPFTSIAGNCRLEDCEIDHSIVLEGSRVTGVKRIADSLIGREATIEPSTDQPRAYRFLVGDHSEIHLP